MLLNYHCQIVKSRFLLSCKLPLTVSGGYNTNARLFNDLNKELFSHEFKILNYDGLWEKKEFSDEIG